MTLHVAKELVNPPDDVYNLPIAPSPTAVSKRSITVNNDKVSMAHIP